MLGSPHGWRWADEVQVDAKGLLNGAAERFMGDSANRLDEPGLVDGSDLMGQDERFLS